MFLLAAALASMMIVTCTRMNWEGGETMEVIFDQRHTAGGFASPLDMRDRERVRNRDRDRQRKRQRDRVRDRDREREKSREGGGIDREKQRGIKTWELR